MKKMIFGIILFVSGVVSNLVLMTLHAFNYRLSQIDFLDALKFDGYYDVYKVFNNLLYIGLAICLIDAFYDKRVANYIIKNIKNILHIK